MALSCLHDGVDIGIITSGGFAPSLDRPAALGFVETHLATDGTVLAAATRGGDTPITVVNLPLVPHRYFRGLDTHLSHEEANHA